jgi:hypothetical protein
MRINASNDTAIAVISLQAFMRIQNQRRRYMSPVPAPIWRMRLNTAPADDRSGAIPAVITIIAAVTAADENTTLEVKDITGNRSMAEVQQIIAAYAVIDSLAAEFFKIPEIEKKNNPEPPAEETEGEDKPKN